MKIGLYFGSFNPVHIGHMAVANYMVEYTDLQEVWFVVSPQNPGKDKASLLDEYQRLELVFRAINDDARFRATDVEFRMPTPSYTIDTLAYLREQHPKHKFVLIMGSDVFATLHKWKNAQVIADNYEILVYPRNGELAVPPLNHLKYKEINAPKMEVSSSMIRNAIAEGKNIRFFIPFHAWQYLDEMNFYKIPK